MPILKNAPTVCIYASHAAFSTLSCVRQVEDIVDTGRTLKSLISSLQQQGVASVKIVTLLNKQARRTVDIQADYVGIQVHRWPGCIVFVSFLAENAHCIVCLHVGLLCNLHTILLPPHDAVTDRYIQCRSSNAILRDCCPSKTLVCLQCPDEFVVGYGLDFEHKYRSLPYIGVLHPKCYQLS